MLSFKAIRNSRLTGHACITLSFFVLFSFFNPSFAYSLPEGPTQPEFNSFTPINVNDLVDPTTGDLSYSIPLMDVGGYPITLGYNSATSFDEASSWVGHGWNLSPGQINRSMRVIPDDFDGSDKIITTNVKKLRESYTLGANLIASLAGLDFVPPGIELAGKMGLEFNYDNYLGSSLSASFGPSFSIHDKLNGSFMLTPSTSEGVSIASQLNYSNKGTSFGLGLGFNNYSGVSSLNPSISSAGKYSREIDYASEALSQIASTSLNMSKPRTFVPSYDIGYSNFSGKVNLNLGTSIYGIIGAGELYAMYSSQRVKNAYRDGRANSAYGYSNYFNYSGNGMRDFSRSHERPFTHGNAVMSVPQNMYDIYSISGGGLAGSFRPFQSQVSFLHDPKVTNTSADMSIGVEVNPGWILTAGGNIEGGYSRSSTGVWGSRGGNDAFDKLKAKNTDNLRPNFRRTHYKLLGENTLKHSQAEPNSFIQKIGGKNSSMFPKVGRRNIDASKYRNYSNQQIQPSTPIGNEIIMENAIPTQKSIVPISVDESRSKYNALTTSSGPIDFSSLNNQSDFVSGRKSHHQSGFKVTDANGTIYNYDIPLYTNTSKSYTFSVRGNNLKDDGSLIGYSDSDPTISNNKGQDEFFSERIIPEYAHTSLLRNILSPDFRDLTGDGPSPDDYGDYTTFDYYLDNNNSKFRFPVDRNTANYMRGAASLQGDDKASFTYGEKQQAYLQRIITKTHVAYFELNDKQTDPRHDNIGVAGKNGGIDPVNQRKRYLKRIHLYTLEQARDNGLLNENINYFNPSNSDPAQKVVHFEYDYSIQEPRAGGVKLPSSESTTYGKLTLKKVFFTFGDSNSGAYTPYEFRYFQDQNFTYHNLNKDVWGNYSPVQETGINPSLSRTEFPYTVQDESIVTGPDSESIPNFYARAFKLMDIKLPSGGIISVNYESDDYSHVQDREAMRLFNIVGAGNNLLTQAPESNSHQLYSASGAKKYLYIQLDDNSLDVNNLVLDFRRKYIRGLSQEPIYFKVKTNIYRQQFKEFITGYTYLENVETMTEDQFYIDSNTGETFVCLEVKQPSLNGGNPNSKVHPFSKATWNYARTYLSKVAFDGTDNTHNNPSVEDVVWQLVRDFESLKNIFKGPNRILREEGCGKTIDIGSSWLRLHDPDGKKYGGGSRVTSVRMDSNWEFMTGISTNGTEPLYGQDYKYNLNDGTSSGVATFEPALSHENPFHLPFEDDNTNLGDLGNNPRLLDKLLSPANLNYVNGPIMKDYYPSAQITYSRVEIKQFTPHHPDPNLSHLQIGNHGTGKIVKEYYTSKDFPTQEDHTPISKSAEVNLGKELSSYVQTLVSVGAIYTMDRQIASQGFYVETNDMNGKPKSETVFPHNSSGNNFLKKTEYHYSLSSQNTLDNEITFIDRQGNIADYEVGVDYDIANDFQFSDAATLTAGADVNVTFFLIPLPAPPFAWPQFITTVIPHTALHENEFRFATTAKHVHRGGILESTTVIDQGAAITTKNLAYDYLSRKPILKSVENEYGDVIYNFNYPSYWVYPEMANASINDGMTFDVATSSGSGEFYFDHSSIIDDEGNHLLQDGDEIIIGNSETMWVTNLDISTKSFDLISKSGVLVSSSNLNLALPAKVVRSAYDNKQSSTVSSISLSRNPLEDSNGNRLTQLPTSFDESYKIFNASAIEMKSEWSPSCECGLESYYNDQEEIFVYDTPGNELNPYFHNIKGHYKPYRSYAYLSGREVADPSGSSVNLRKDGFYRDFNSFYTQNTSGEWLMTGLGNNSWTFSSEVSKVSLYGTELENKDALNRYSAATYGFNNKFPDAIGSNAEYRELAYDGFEDYDQNTCGTDSHFNFIAAQQQGVIEGNIYYSNGIMDHTTALSTDFAHTGTTSYRVQNNQHIAVEKRITPCNSNANVEEIFGRLLAFLVNNQHNLGPGCLPFDNLGDLIDAQSPPISNSDLEELINFQNYICLPEGQAGPPAICNVQSGDGFNFYDAPDLSSDELHVNWGSFPVINNPFVEIYGVDLDPSTFTTDCTDYNTSIGGPIRYVDGTVGYYDILNVSHVNFENTNCLDCTSFSPLPSHQYVVSAWVKQDLSSIDTSTPEGLQASQPLTYEDTGITITFFDSNGQQIISNNPFYFEGSGPIINGWQKVYGIFEVNNSAHGMKVILNNTSGYDSYFDDLRIHPVQGSMKSFVYDNSTYRLVSELDENNFASFYEYDREGNLIRVKKETERGVMTIQESRQNTFKNLE